MKKPNAWYARQVWKGPNGVRAMKLHRTPLCEVIGCDKPATCCDHKRAFMTGRTEQERWELFIGGVDFQNLRSCCQEHHDSKPTSYEDGRAEHNPISATGAAGRQFASATVTQAEIDRALPQTQEETAELLSGIPE